MVTISVEDKSTRYKLTFEFDDALQAADGLVRLGILLKQNKSVEETLRSTLKVMKRDYSFLERRG